jgi:hypothetical protein
MVRFYSSIYANDEVLITQTNGNGVFHGFPPPNRCRTHRTKTECLGSVPDDMKRSVICVRNSLICHDAESFAVEVAEMSRLTCPRVAKSLGCKPDQ